MPELRVYLLVGFGERYPRPAPVMPPTSDVVGILEAPVRAESGAQVRSPTSRP